VLCAISALCVGAVAQSQGAAGDPPDLTGPLAALQRLTPEITGTLDATHWQRWKLKNDDKLASDRALTSLHSDLDQVLPPLLTAAQASPGSVAAGLAVYRNVNALYNVLLRLQQTAELIAKDDAPPLQDVLGRLDLARNGLAEQLTEMAQRQETNLAASRSALAALRQAAAHPQHVVVDDAEPVKKRAATGAKSRGRAPVSSKTAKPKTSAAKHVDHKPSSGTPAQ
jgi:hypothetical protein